MLSVEVYNTISGSIQYYHRKYTILSPEVYNTISIQQYQWNIQYYMYVQNNIIISHHKSCFLFIVSERIKVASLINLAHHKSIFLSKDKYVLK